MNRRGVALGFRQEPREPTAGAADAAPRSCSPPARRRRPRQTSRIAKSCAPNGTAHPRLLQSPCSESEAMQGWSVKPTGQGVYSITDSNDRCLTTYSGLGGLRAAIVMPCSGGADQRWVLDSRTPNGKGPYTIRSPLTDACMSNVGKELVQA